MTLPNDDLKTLLRAVRVLYREAKKAGVTQTQFAIDIGISPSTLNFIIRYKGYRPGQYVQERLRSYVDKVRQQCPEEVTQK